MYPRDAGGGGRLRGVAPVLISLFMLSIVPGTALAQESVWTELAPATSPPGRSSHDMAYDEESDRIVLFGGATGFESGFKDDTWAYDFNANTWMKMNPGTRPSPRWGHAMAYDGESDRMILFGGNIPGPETWAYDYNANTWTNMSPVVQPDAWHFADLAYDAESDRIVLFGGCAEVQWFACPPVTRGETWSYDFNANMWMNMNPDTSPSRRHSNYMAYDAGSDRIVLFGGILGTSGAGLLGDTWAYDFNANSWVEMNPPEAPFPDDTHSMVYDPKADRIVLVQSWHSPEDTWAYDFDRDTWTRTARDMGPSQRAVPRLAYDTESERMVLFGGGTGSGFNAVGNAETWAHQLVPSEPDPIPPWVYIVIGVVAAAVVAVVAVVLTRRRKGMRKGAEGE